ncbi:hypothetical protein [Nitrosopumilus adriaticus]|uniref:hypothetical protein n=1 Tax=Nitrosopumilus adriaticus TaxID=1580092 RepID=UPI00352FEA1F
MGGLFLIISIVFSAILITFSFSSAYSESTAYMKFEQNVLETGHEGMIIYYNSTFAGNGNLDTSTVDISATCYSAPFTINMKELIDDGYLNSTMITYDAVTTCGSVTSPNPNDVNITLKPLINTLTNATSAIPGTIASINVTSVNSGVIGESNKNLDYDWADCVNHGGDTDSDGICNTWEDQAAFIASGWDPGLWISYPYVDGTNSTMYHYGCDSAGCPSIDRKDIYLEIDWMTNHQPDPDAIKDVVDSFDKAPVDCSGTVCKGIRLHVQDGGMGDEIPDAPNGIYFPGINHPRFTPGFDQVKAYYFGNSTERTDPEWDLYGWKQKKQVFHYALFAHSQKGAPTSSGTAELFGNDILITFGGWEQVPSKHFQAGTLMHELGHNLKLNHGGAGSDLVNCKPNYFSVMNYMYQLPILEANRPLNYSGFAHASLDMAALVESDGVNLIPNGNQQPIVYGPVEATWDNWETGKHVDWNANGVIDTNTVQEYINYLPSEGCTNSQYEVLTGFNDWDNIDLNSRGTGNWADGRMINECKFPSQIEVKNNGKIKCTPVEKDTFTKPDKKPQKKDVNIKSKWFDKYPDRMFASGIGELTYENYKAQTIFVVNKIDEKIQALSPSDFIGDPIQHKLHYAENFTKIKNLISLGKIDDSQTLLNKMKKTFDDDESNNKILFTSASNSGILKITDNSLQGHAKSLERAMGNPPGPGNERAFICEIGEIQNHKNECIVKSKFCGDDTKFKDGKCLSKIKSDPILGFNLGALQSLFIAATVILSVLLAIMLRKKSVVKSRITKS